MQDADLTYDYVLTARNYVSKVTHNLSDLIYMKRRQIYQKDTKIVDAYGPLWIVGFSDLPSHQISIQSQGRNIELNGKWGFFSPSFNIIHWSIRPGEYTWEACVSHNPLPDRFGECGFLFPWSGQVPKTYADLIELLDKTTERVFFEQQIKVSSMSEKVKKFIDSNYTNEINISQIAHNFEFSWAFMSREFKKVYGISPIEYRHRLRLFHSIKLLSMGTPITEACFASGFNSLTQFNTHFKSLLGTPPSSYNYKKICSKLLKTL